MSDHSVTPGPGLLFVLSRPKPEHIQDFEDWYNTEHGPLRTSLDFILNGYRYKSRSVDPPVFLATYDLIRISGLDEPQYTSLRQYRSPREEALMESMMSFVDRRVYRSLTSRDRGNISGPAPCIIVAIFTVKDSLANELHRWYEEEHIPDFTQIPGWRRSRRFQLVEGENQKDGCAEFLAIHDFDQANGIDGSEHQLARSKPWRMKIMGLVEDRENIYFDFLHEFKASDYQNPKQPKQ